MRPSQEVGEPHPRVALLFRFLENDAMCHRLVTMPCVIALLISFLSIYVYIICNDYTAYNKPFRRINSLNSLSVIESHSDLS